jgi:hypothetical protein
MIEQLAALPLQQVLRDEVHLVLPVAAGIPRRQLRQFRVPFDADAAQAGYPRSQAKQGGARATSGFQNTFPWPGGHGRRQENGFDAAAEARGRLHV